MSAREPCDVDLARRRQRRDGGGVHLRVAGEELVVGVHGDSSWRRRREKRRGAEVLLTLPCAGIIRIRFQGFALTRPPTSHAAARTPSVGRDVTPNGAAPGKLRGRMRARDGYVRMRPPARAAARHVPADARFCPQCGTPLGDAPRRRGRSLRRRPSGGRSPSCSPTCPATRRCRATLEPEEVHRLLTRYFELVDGADRAMRRHHRQAHRRRGDGACSARRSRTATTRCARCAPRSASTPRWKRCPRNSAGRCSAHVGVASGEVVAADTGSTVHRNYTVTGDAVNLAARLDELARAGETVISDDVYRALAHVIDAEPRAPCRSAASRTSCRSGSCARCARRAGAATTR